MPKGKDLSGGFDAIYNGVEITSGGQRVHIPEILIKRLKEKGLDPKDLKDILIVLDMVLRLTRVGD